MYFLILFFPLLSVMFDLLFASFLIKQYVIWFSILLLFLTFCSSIFIFYEVALSGVVTTIKLFDWITLSGYDICFGFSYDTLTSVMLLIITCISFFVHLYSIDYMGNDLHISRFIGYLSLFTFFYDFLSYFR